VSTGPARVLLVDDNAALAENLAEILSDAGYEPRIAGGYAAALRIAETGFDVALVDLQLPDGDGTMLSCALREQQPDSEVVLLTGHASVQSAAEAVRAGASAYLIKPCPPDELLLAVDRAVKQVRLQRDRRDLARRAQMAERLATVGTLTAGLSHEIRNPLNAAGLQLSVLERRIAKLTPELQPALLEPLSLVRDEIRRLDALLEEFLQFARPRELRPERLSPGLIAASVTALLQGDAERRGVQLSCVAEGWPEVQGESDRLRQVLVNLLINALDAAGEGGAVELSGAVVEGRLELHVDDSGPGVPPERRERIFEPFFTDKPRGSGLGLAIVHAIVVQHGGAISVGEAPLGGARFAISLPVAAAG